MLKQFENKDLSFKLVSQDPVELFRDWYGTACTTKEIAKPSALALGTATIDGRSSTRMVSLRSFDKDGFKWNTTYTSRKGEELEKNPRASMLFYWDNYKFASSADAKDSGYSRQVKIEGSVKKRSAEECLADYKSIPPYLQVAFAACVQDKVIPNREYLEAKRKEVSSKELTPVDGWGGYILKPDKIEFYQQWENDPIVDRISFRKEKSGGEKLDSALTHKTDQGWLIERVSP